MGRGKHKLHKLHLTTEQSIARAERELAEKRKNKQSDSITFVKKQVPCDQEPMHLLHGVAVQNVDGGETCYIVDGTVTFTAEELATSANLPHFLDMSYVLTDKNMLFDQLGDSLEEEDPQFRIYMRTEQNQNLFAMLQRSLETLYLNGKSLETLQGWILQYGTCFVFGKGTFSLEESRHRLVESFRHAANSVNNDTASTLLQGAISPHSASCANN